MRGWVLSAVVIAVLAVAAPARAAEGGSDTWRRVLDGRCENCGPRDTAHDKPALPHHAITSMFVGEFTSEVELCVIDLDSGDLHCHSGPGGSGPVPRSPVVERDSHYHIDPALLDEIRAEAARLWQPTQEQAKVEHWLKLMRNRRGRKLRIPLPPPPPVEPPLDVSQLVIFPGCAEDRNIVSRGRQTNYGVMGFRDDIHRGANLRVLVGKALMAANESTSSGSYATVPL